MCYQVRNLGVILTPSSPLLLTSYELQILLNMIQYFQFFYSIYTLIYQKCKSKKRKKKFCDKKSLILALPHPPSSQTPAIVSQCYWFLIYSSGDLKNTTVYKCIYCTSLLPPVTCFTLMLETWTLCLLVFSLNDTLFRSFRIKVLVWQALWAAAVFLLIYVP